MHAQTNLELLHRLRDSIKIHIEFLLDSIEFVILRPNLVAKADLTEVLQ